MLAALVVRLQHSTIKPHIYIWIYTINLYHHLILLTYTQGIAFCWSEVFMSRHRGKTEVAISPQINIETQRKILTLAVLLFYLNKVFHVWENLEMAVWNGLVLSSSPQAISFCFVYKAGKVPSNLQKGSCFIFLNKNLGGAKYSTLKNLLCRLQSSKAYKSIYDYSDKLAWVIYPV